VVGKFLALSFRIRSAIAAAIRNNTHEARLEDIQSLLDIHYRLLIIGSDETAAAARKVVEVIRKSLEFEESMAADLAASDVEAERVRFREEGRRWELALLNATRSHIDTSLSKLEVTGKGGASK